jgi:hypothetical protein
MIQQLQELVKKLKKENRDRTEAMNKGLSDYGHTVAVHTYNYTLDIIKQLEAIIGKQSEY